MATSAEIKLKYLQDASKMRHAKKPVVSIKNDRFLEFKSKPVLCDPPPPPKKRGRRPKEKNPLQDVVFFELQKRDPVIEKPVVVQKPIQKVDFSKVAAYAGPVKDKLVDKNPDVSEKKIDLEPKKFTRPPAEYSNSSPYGIASDLLNGKI